MHLKRQAVAEFLAREFDEYTWMKALTAKQIHTELCSMRTMPYFKTEPWLHQLVCFLIGMYRPEFLYLLDMGAGKTKIGLDLITQRQREKRLDHALIGVPRKINIESWKDDVLLHSDLEPWDCSVEDIEEKWYRLSEPQGDLTIIDYQGLHLALCGKKRAKKGNKLVIDEKKVKRIQKLYNFIIMDESHKLANWESLWFAILRRLTAAAEFKYATTGTLFGRDPQAIWPQFFLVDRGETFGENLGLFRGAFFKALPNKWGRGEKYEYDAASDQKLHRMLQHRSLRYEEDEIHDLPLRVPLIKQFTMTEEQNGHYLRALEGLINANGNLQEMDGQWHRMRQIVAGYLAWEDEHGKHVQRFKENPKLDGLEALIDGMGRAKCVIPYDYTETGRMICERVKEMGIDYEWFYGGTKDQSASRRRFMDDPNCKVFVMNTSAGGTGNDGLQKVARYMFLYETPTNPIDRKQVIKRISRPGQKMRTFIYDLVMRRSLDPGILKDLAENLDTYSSVVGGKRKPGRGFFTQDVSPGFKLDIV